MKKLIFIFTLFLSYLGYAQDIHSVVASSGAFLSGTTLQLDFVVGEVAIMELSSGSNSLQQGFLQSNEILLSAKEEAQNIELQIFPNPNSTGFFQINTEATIRKIELTDVLGNSELFDSGEHIKTTLKGILIVRIWSDEGLITKKIEVL